MADTIIQHPALAGALTFLLMEADWLLSIVQHRAMESHYKDHYETYPIRTVEGNPLLRRAVSHGRWIDLRHLIPALVVSCIVYYVMSRLREDQALLVLGLIWGTFFALLAIHSRNVWSYAAGRRGVHGKIWIHMRTGYQMSLGQYAGLLIFAGLLAVLDPSPFLVGIALSCVVAIARVSVFLLRAPRIETGDPPPSESTQPPTG
jgi:hypothetical protein